MIKINLYDEFGSDLGQRYLIKEIFENLDNNSQKVIFDFKDIDFVSRSFAQEYLNHKMMADYEIEEMNIPDVVKNMFNVILKNNNFDEMY
ncbi:MAG: DUF4325 domain-containing protein [Methanobrevibacter sp.]|uniref:STAS-like domain-containing protein n=1 Tax=Methanobrevibacter sp. TaxID=66852 RepID=UPI0025E43B73|nr:DUF4325 domain-containing protein [Methanobrevibacter sp.]MBR0272283.1 DUF4325 domain-containing protein [Methanobrevibacter sp.]